MTDSALEIHPVRHPLRTVVVVPGSKSQTNRALLIAALARGRTRLNNALFSDDSLVMARALQCLGFEVRLDAAQSTMEVTGRGGVLPAKKARLFVGNAGTAARFLTAFLALGHGEYVLDGDARMRERPIGPLAAALTALGAQIETAGGCPPVRIQASGWRGGRAQITGSLSSQFLSALLMNAPYAPRPVCIEVTGELNSRPYADMTLSVMKAFGVEVEGDGRLFNIRPATYSALAEYSIESDASAASYFFAAAAICGGTLRVENIRRQSLQGDIAFLDLLDQMGCSVKQAGNAIEVTGTPCLCGLEVDLRHTPDLAQTLAAIAPFAVSPTTLRGIASARLKETDRIRAMCTELTRLGVRVEEHEDGLTIHPCRRLRPARVQTYKDHRMAMAFSLIGLRSAGVEIEDPACVSKTFPEFFKVLESLQ